MKKLPQDRPLALDDFRTLAKDAVIILHYCCVNRGTFVWCHDRVEENRVWGRFAYEGQSFNEIGSYLYECGGVVCQGSGAEPVWTVMPEGEPADLLIDGRLYVPNRKGRTKESW